MANIVYCEINAEDRTIIIPDSEQLFGVESDEGGERRYFRCPKIVGDGIDLSKADIYVNMQNASGTQAGKDRYPVENLKTDGDYITFSWLFERKVTRYEGTVKFSICAIIPQTGKEWNTTVAEGKVLEGLELLAPEEQESRGSDYITALTDDATITSETILNGYTGYAKGQKVIGSYIPLDTSDADATPENIENGKIVYVDGEKVTGSLPVNDNLVASLGKEENLGWVTSDFTLGSTTYHMEYLSANAKIYANNDNKKMILDGDSQYAKLNISSTYLGNANPEDVRKGKTFTSSAGLKKTGTLEVDGKSVKTGSLNGTGSSPITIATGLSNVEKFILYTVIDSVSTSGICSLVWDSGNVRAVGASYGSYMSTITLDAGTVTVSGGNVTYTPSTVSKTNMMQDVTYNWIAIGA